MFKYSIEERVWMIKKMAKSDANPRSVVRDWQSENQTCSCPDLRTVVSLWDKFNKTGSVADDRQAMGHQSRLMTEENKELVDAFFAKEPNESVRRACLRLNISRSTLQRIMRELSLSPYKIQLNQALNEDHKERRFQFAMDMLEKIDNDGITPNKIWFSDEAYFSLDGHLNKQNYRFWGKQRPEISIVRNLHPKKVLVWAAISAQGVEGPYFLGSSVTADRYTMMLEEQFFPFVQSKNMVDGYWFMQDGARPHRTQQVFQALNSVFNGRVIGLDADQHMEGAMTWPQYSPDLNPCDFFLWGYLKEIVWKSNPKTVPELQRAITSAFGTIEKSLCERVMASFKNRLTTIIAKEGGHFEHLYH